MGVILTTGMNLHPNSPKGVVLSSDSLEEPIMIPPSKVGQRRKFDE